MLDPTAPSSPWIVGIVLAGILALIVVRSVRRDKREYRRFQNYRTTARRQKTLKKWLWDSFAVFGGLSAVSLVVVWQWIAPFLDQLTALPVVAPMRHWASDNVLIVALAIVAVIAVIVVITIMGGRAIREEDDGEVPAVGDIIAMLPRNRQELRIGALMSINAGVVEELAFRLAVPVLVFALTDNALLSLTLSVVLFGLLHVYQGVAGIIGTALLGALFALALVLSGGILAPIALHILIDLRTLVLLPMVLWRVQHIDGAKQRLIPRRKALRTPEPHPAASPEAVSDATT